MLRGVRRVTHAALLSELDFIRLRAIWLRQQPRDSDGTLLISDHREEAAMLGRRIEELQRIHANITQ